ncbi:MAG TPA: 50S ribosomal protein L9 [Terriglobia bacterium]|nr:50S ribosomal protein L9 [Terriglobia bacterium]
MEVILLEDMDKLGGRGQIVKVADGYARNFLIPQKHALKATPQNKKWLEQQRVRFLKQEAKEKGEAEELAKLFEGVIVTETRKAGEAGQLFGSVTSQDIADKLAAQGFKIDKRKIQLAHPIKIVGEYDVNIRLHREVFAKVHVKVEGELTPEAIAAQAAAAAAAAKAQKAEAAAQKAAAEAAPAEKAAEEPTEKAAEPAKEDSAS